MSKNLMDTKILRSDLMKRLGVIKDCGYNVNIEELDTISSEDLEKEYYRLVEQMTRDKFISTLKT